MKQVIHSVLVVFAATLYAGVHACPFTIVNDSSDPIMVVDPHGQSAIYIKRGKSLVIDPTIHSMWKYIRNEKLDFYVESENNVFHKKYQLVEAYCVTEEENELRFSELEKLLKKPTDRLSVIKYEQPIHRENAHSH